MTIDIPPQPEPQPPDTTVVVAAIFRRDGRILAARRRPGLRLASYWEFPGGKIEKGESPQQALRRELSEELAIDAEIGPFCGQSLTPHDHGQLQLLGYFVDWYSGIMQPSDHDELRWLSPEKLLSLEWAPADLVLVQQILRNQ